MLSSVSYVFVDECDVYSHLTRYLAFLKLRERMITSEMRLFTDGEPRSRRRILGMSGFAGEVDRSSLASSLLVVETHTQKREGTDIENQGIEEEEDNESKIYRQLIRVRRCRMFFVDVIFDIDVIVIVVIDVFVVLVFVVAVLRCRR